MRHEDGPYPWNDGGRVEREFLRNWRGMPLRNEWNAAPGQRNCQTCTSCGYRWDQFCFTYRGAARVTGELPPVALHPVCWNCFMCENEPLQVRKYWDAVERANAPAVAARKEPPRLKTLGDK